MEIKEKYDGNNLKITSQNESVISLDDLLQDRNDLLQRKAEIENLLVRADERISSALSLGLKTKEEIQAAKLSI